MYREVRSRSNISSRNNFRDLPENIDENGNIKHVSLDCYKLTKWLVKKGI